MPDFSVVFECGATDRQVACQVIHELDVATRPLMVRRTGRGSQHRVTALWMVDADDVSDALDEVVRVLDPLARGWLREGVISRPWARLSGMYVVFDGAPAWFPSQTTAEASYVVSARQVARDAGTAPVERSGDAAADFHEEIKRTFEELSDELRGDRE